MEDFNIIELYWQRDEQAIAETDLKYGRFCHAIAFNLLNVQEDAEECVSDTWCSAWEQIPPARPAKFKAWLGRIIRNISISLWHRNHAQKRNSGLTELLDELEDCIPAAPSVEQTLETAALGKFISSWLLSLSEDDRIMFVRRYWYGLPLKDLACDMGTDAGKLAQRMYRLRLSLKDALEKEGFGL